MPGVAEAPSSEKLKWMTALGNLAQHSRLTDVSWTAVEIIMEDQIYSLESGTTFQIDRCKLTSVELITEDQTCSWESGTTFQIDRCLLNISRNYYRRSDRQLGIWHNIPDRQMSVEHQWKLLQKIRQAAGNPAHHFQIERCKLNISGHYYRRSNEQLGEKRWQKQDEDTEACCKARQSKGWTSKWLK